MRTRAENSTLEIETGPIVVECRSCGTKGEAGVNRLLCASCGDWQVNLIQGDELLLMRVEVSGISPSIDMEN